MEWLGYLLKVSACSVLFFAFYLVALKRLTFFSTNRFYLLITLIISFIIPALQFTIERETNQSPIVNTEFVADQLPIEKVGTPILNQPATEPIVVAKSFDWYSLVPFGYGIVAIIFLGIALWRLFQLIRHTKAVEKNVNGLKLVPKKTGFTNCSFFNYVFIDAEQLSPQELLVLLKHEEVHAKQLHSLDKILLMIVKAILWFNPVIYLYDKALEQTHEYEADQTTSENYGANNYAGLLLRLAVNSQQLPLVHNFVKSPIKERIKMLFNDKSNSMKKLMYLLTIPVGLVLIWGFTVDVINVFPNENNSQNEEFTLIIDAGHGGSDLGAKSNGYTEKAITLTMAKKIKVMAESRGIRVLLTRDSDANISLAERAKLDGTLFISLHVASAPSENRNGIEMITSGAYSAANNKLAKSNGLSYQLYQEMKNLTGIKVGNKPLHQKILLLDQVNTPGLVLEMGYLSNSNDFKFITNTKKQDELVTRIVNAIATYKEKLPASEAMQAKFKKFNEEFEVKYKAWKSSERYAWLLNESKNFRAQTLLGTIQSLNYSKLGENQILDGFILNTNQKLYRIYLDKEQIKAVTFKAGDQVSLYAPKLEVWFDSNYPAIKPKKLVVTAKVGAVAPAQPRLISSFSLQVDTKNEITYLNKAQMEIGEMTLKAENILWDKKSGILTAEKAILTGKDGVLLTSGSIKYNINANTYQTYSPVGQQLGNAATIYDLSKLPYLAQDSVKLSKDKDKLTLYGKASIKIADRVLTGEKIELDKKSQVITAYNAELTGVQAQTIKAKVISFNLQTKTVLTGERKNTEVPKLLDGKF